MCFQDHNSASVSLLSLPVNHHGSQSTIHEGSQPGFCRENIAKNLSQRDRGRQGQGNNDFEGEKSDCAERRHDANIEVEGVEDQGIEEGMRAFHPRFSCLRASFLNDSMMRSNCFSRVFCTRRWVSARQASCSTVSRHQTTMSPRRRQSSCQSVLKVRQHSP